MPSTSKSVTFHTYAKALALFSASNFFFVFLFWNIFFDDFGLRPSLIASSIQRQPTVYISLPFKSVGSAIFVCGEPAVCWFKLDFCSQNTHRALSSFSFAVFFLFLIFMDARSNIRRCCIWYGIHIYASLDFSIYASKRTILFIHFVCAFFSLSLSFFNVANFSYLLLIPSMAKDFPFLSAFFRFFFFRFCFLLARFGKRVFVWFCQHLMTNEYQYCSFSAQIKYELNHVYGDFKRFTEKNGIHDICAISQNATLNGELAKKNIFFYEREKKNRAKHRANDILGMKISNCLSGIASWLAKKPYFDQNPNHEFKIQA